MQYFKCLNLSSPVFYSVQEVLGPKGAWEALKAVSHALMLNIDSMDEKTVVIGAGVKRDRAKRLLPFAQEILSETHKIYKKSTRNVDEIYPESDQNVSGKCKESNENLQDSHTSNPHGSTRVLKEEDKDKEEDFNNKKPNPPEFEKAYALAVNLAKNSVNGKLDGVQELLLNSFTIIKPKDLTLDQVYQCWEEACEYWNVSTPYVKTTFKNKMAEYHTKQKKPYQVHSTALPGNQITPAHKRQAGVIDIS